MSVHVSRKNSLNLHDCIRTLDETTYQVTALHEEIQTLEKALRAEMKSVVAPGLSPDHVLEIRTSILSYRRRLMDVKQQMRKSVRVNEKVYEMLLELRRRED